MSIVRTRSCNLIAQLKQNRKLSKINQKLCRATMVGSQVIIKEQIKSNDFVFKVIGILSTYILYSRLNYQPLFGKMMNDDRTRESGGNRA